VVAHIGELFRYRDLVRNLVVCDLRVRYRNSALGFFWSLLSPLLMMIVFTFVFTVMVPSGGPEHYPIFFLAGLLPWQFFTNSISVATVSVVENAHLIKKIYFPRDVLPLARVLSNLVHFLLALLVFFALYPFFGMRISGWVLLLPAIILIQLSFTLGLAFVFSTLNVFYRDTRHVTDTLMLLWFFLTPVFYSLDNVRPAFLGLGIDLHRLIYTLNPMASLVALYRAVLYYGVPPDLGMSLGTSLIALICLWIGYRVFCRYRGSFSEEV